MRARQINFLLFAVFLAAAVPAAAQQNGEVNGRVVSAQSNEPLALVQIQLQGTSFRAVTVQDGKFRIADVPPGNYTLEASTVGYYLLRQEFTLAAGETKSLDVVLASSTSTLTNTVDVSADPFQLETNVGVSGFTLEGQERKNLASVLADDPLRAVQSLPGVTSNNDFSSEFSIRGAAFDRVGIYFDGVLLHAPVHTTDGQADNGSLTIFNGDLTEDMTLYQGAWPVRYSDRTAGVLAVTSREGSREKIQGQATASLSNAGVTLEGPWGKNQRGSWLGSFRKSYLQYILNRIDFGDQAPLAFGFTDGQVRLSYDLSKQHNVSLSYLDGTSSVDRTRFHDELSPNTIMTSAFRFTFLNAGWRYAPNEHLLIANHVSWAQERGDTANRDATTLSDGSYHEWTWHGDATAMLGQKESLDFGGQFRHIRQEGLNHELVYTPELVSALDTFNGNSNEGGAYAQESLNLGGRLHMTVGVRQDNFAVAHQGVTSPYGSMSFSPWENTKLEFSFGQYSQYPELSQLFSTYAHSVLLPERATHYEAALEQRLNERTRLRVEVYDRQDRDLLARPLLVPRVLPDGSVFTAQPDAPWLNSERGYARGFEVFLQRRSANGLTGWISYAYSRTGVRDGALQVPNFPTDYDQQHTLNAYVSRRLRTTVNVSARLTYGTGMPLPGFYELVPGGYAVSQYRNAVRAPAYQRTDLRLNKAYIRTKIKTTVYGEIVNITNHKNSDFDTPGPYDTVTHQSYPNFYSMFPILPSVGVSLEF